jgi:hypothetical protein
MLSLSMMALASLVIPSASATSERATLGEAKAMVRKAREYLRKYGRERALAEIGKTDGMFVDRDIYVYVLDRNLTKLADGGEPRLVGKDTGEMRDPEGNCVNQRLLEVAQKGGGTFTFEFLNPATRRIEIKTGYAEMEGDLVVGSGVYMPAVALPGPLAPDLPHVAGMA